MIDFKANVKTMCKLKGMQQKELAEKLGITEIGLSRNLAKNNPRLDTMERVADALGVSLIEMLTCSLGETQEKKEPPMNSGGSMLCPHCGGEIELFARAKK